MINMVENSLTEQLAKSGVIAVLVIERVEDAVPVAKALLAGGVSTIELTMRTPAALGALKEIREQVPEMLAGMGTILTPEQVKLVKDADGAFGVAPGLNRRVLEKAMEVRLPFAPGITTPSDIETALEYGLRILKFFPAEPAGGLKYLQNMNAPYAHLGLKYMPLGGISASNMRQYLEEPAILAVGGSWLAKKEIIAAGDWNRITANAKEAREIAEKCKTERG